MFRSFKTPLLMMVVNLLCLAAMAPHAAQAATVKGSGKVVTENRTVGEFAAVASQGSFDVVVRQGNAPAVQVSADDNLVPLIETVVENGRDGATLQLRWKRGTSIQTRSAVKVTVTTPKLTALTASGSGDFTIEAFKTPVLKVSLKGSGNAAFESLATDELTVSLAGSGDVSGSGRATRLAVSIAGAGDVSLGDLKADDVKVDIAGSGDATVHAGKTLAVSIAGAGDVNYSGEAQVKSRILGAGSVNKR